ncbi:MAG: MBL fold metallo-hydrolase [Clostridia bacterium]|nr:MBL fold metallo-hydrolase [Clostridia bacterium]
MNLFVLGTGHAFAEDIYNTCFCLQNGNDFMLVDAGGGREILKQLDLSLIDLNMINYAFISHTHTDHLLGFAWVIRKIVQSYISKERTLSFTIYGNAECINAIHHLSLSILGEKIFNTYFEKFIKLEEVKADERKNIMNLNFNFFDVLDPDLTQFGFEIEEYKFVFAGDIPLNKCYYDRFKNCRYICLEAFCAESDKEGKEAQLKKHKTVHEASVAANKLNAENVIIWHTENCEFRKVKYSLEAKKSYKGNIIIPDDLELIYIEKFDENE